MPDGSLEMFPGGAGMARFPILAQAGFDVVPGLAAVMVGGRHGRTVAVGGQIVLVAAAAAAVVGLVVLAERRIVVRTQHGAVLGTARAGRAATQLLHLHFGAAYGVGNLLFVLADLFAHHHFFHRLAQLDGFVFEAGHFRRADGLVDGAALDADVFFTQGERLVDGGFHHPLENAYAAPLHLAFAHPQFLFHHGQHRAFGALPRALLAAQVSLRLAARHAALCAALAADTALHAAGGTLLLHARGQPGAHCARCGRGAAGQLAARDRLPARLLVDVHRAVPLDDVGGPLDFLFAHGDQGQHVLAPRHQIGVAAALAVVDAEQVGKKVADARAEAGVVRRRSRSRTAGRAGAGGGRSAAAGGLVVADLRAGKTGGIQLVLGSLGVVAVVENGNQSVLHDVPPKNVGAAPVLTCVPPCPGPAPGGWSPPAVLPYVRAVPAVPAVPARCVSPSSPPCSSKRSTTTCPDFRGTLCWWRRSLRVRVMRSSSLMRMRFSSTSTSSSTGTTRVSPS